MGGWLVPRFVPLELPTDDMAAWRRSRSRVPSASAARCCTSHPRPLLVPPPQVVAQKGSTTPPDRRLAELLRARRRQPSPPPGRRFRRGRGGGSIAVSISLAAELHAVREEARAACSCPRGASRLPRRRGGGRLQVLAADGPPRWCFLRVRPSASSSSATRRRGDSSAPSRPPSTALALHDLDAPARACGLRPFATLRARCARRLRR